MQRVISSTSFSIEIPGINLVRWTQQVEDTVNLIEAIRTDLPDHVRNEGAAAVDLFEDLILSGATPREAAEFVSSDEAREALQVRNNWYKARDFYGGASRIPEDVKRLILAGIDIGFDEQGRPLGYIDCTPTSGATCAIFASAFGIDAAGAADIAREKILSFLEAYSSRSFLERFTGNRFEGRILRDLMELYAYCVDDFTGYEFLSDNQIALVDTITGFSVEYITDVQAQRRMFADEIDANLLYQPLQDAFASMGNTGLDQYNNFLSEIYSNLRSGGSFTSTNSLGDLASMFEYLQRAGNPDAMRTILASFSENATDEQKFEIELTFEWAAQYNTILATSEVVSLLWGARALASDVVSARNAWRQAPGRGVREIDAPDWGVNTRFSRTEWQAPSGSGTGQRYTIYQQEIDWDLEVDGLSNL